MKKRVLSLVILATIFALCMAGCGKSDKKDSSKETNQETTNNSGSEDGYLFAVNDVAMSVDSDTSMFIDELGEPVSYFESESCAAQGIGKLYTFTDFEIQTYPDGDVDRVLYILLKTDAVSTREGIDLSSSKDDVLAAYGDPTEESDTTLIYEKGGMKLVFIFDGEDMTSIEYDSSLV